MVITILKAHVPRDRISDLEHAYREGTGTLPPEIVETFLVRESSDASQHRIVTIWTSKEALEKMRASLDKPKGVQMFEAAGVTPELSVLDVVVHAERDRS